MKLFEAPAVLDEFDGEPVQQLRMGRTLAARPEVVRRADEALTEVPLPDAIDDDACRERVLRRGDPVGKCRAPRTGRPFAARLATGERGGQSGIDAVAGSMQLAAV